MQGTTNFTLSVSGAPFLATNSTADTTQISLMYTASWTSAPISIQIFIEGISAANGGNVGVLDSFSLAISTGPQSHTVNLNGASYDGFQFTAIFGGGSGVTVSVTLTSSSGAGATFSAAQDLATIHTE